MAGEPAEKVNPFAPDPKVPTPSLKINDDGILESVVNGVATPVIDPVTGGNLMAGGGQRQVKMGGKWWIVDTNTGKQKPIIDPSTGVQMVEPEKAGKTQTPEQTDLTKARTGLAGAQTDKTTTQTAIDQGKLADQPREQDDTSYLKNARADSLASNAQARLAQVQAQKYRTDAAIATAQMNGYAKTAANKIAIGQLSRQDYLATISMMQDDVANKIKLAGMYQSQAIAKIMDDITLRSQDVQQQTALAGQRSQFAGSTFNNTENMMERLAANNKGGKGNWQGPGAGDIMAALLGGAKNYAGQTGAYNTPTLARPDTAGMFDQTNANMPQAPDLQGVPRPQLPDLGTPPDVSGLFKTSAPAPAAPMVAGPVAGLPRRPPGVAPVPTVMTPQGTGATPYNPQGRDDAAPGYST